LFGSEGCAATHVLPIDWEIFGANSGISNQSKELAEEKPGERLAGDFLWYDVVMDAQCGAFGLVAVARKSRGRRFGIATPYLDRCP
jgi:hypothetical protein